MQFSLGTTFPFDTLLEDIIGAGDCAIQSFVGLGRGFKMLIKCVSGFGLCSQEPVKVSRK